ncbi:hypothetical protein [Methylosinus sp. KRF6]|uniref:type IVB secretion system protein IcmW n=1 Tax=Methylosinus sp. KRF6 TaxID=2846853 RepID=UPI001C0CEC92|nr:hypothetical protein [Methylosinus sp. KRF6]MBU3888024.1 hypothetical protein [Methylosinus sp. KRF6]
MPDLDILQTGSWLDPSRLDLLSELPEAARRAELDPSVESAVVALGVALDDAAAFDPPGLARCIRTDPSRTLFQSVLAQLGTERLLRLLVWLTEPDKPNRKVILAALIAPEVGDASDAIRRATRFATRNALLRRITAELRIRSLALCAMERRRDKFNQRESYL